MFSSKPQLTLLINMDITGKVALVTGGAGGIGKAMVETLLQKGAKGIFIIDVNEEALQEVKEELEKKYGDGKVHTSKCDVSSMEEMEECFKMVISTYGELHIVCNNAGISNEINWQRMLEINLNGVIIGSKLAVEYMDGENSGGGVIINTSSVFGLSHSPFATVYSTSKCAVIGFTRSLATFDPMVIKKKIRVNALCPPGVSTPLLHNLIAEKPYQTLVDRSKNVVPKMQPSELSEHFVKLIEEPHNGQILFVANADKNVLIPDESKAFRQQTGMDEPMLKFAKAGTDFI